MDDTENTIKVGDHVEINTPDDLDWHQRTGNVVQINGENCLVKLDDTNDGLMVRIQDVKPTEPDISLIEYYVGQSAGYGGGAMAGGAVAPTNWAGTFSSNQT